MKSGRLVAAAVLAWGVEIGSKHPMHCQKHIDGMCATAKGDAKR